MALKITWLGHSAFAVEIGGPDEVEAEVIFVSHGHGDHMGDTLPIAQRTGALVITNAEIGGWLRAKGIQNVHGQNTGGGADHGWFHARLTIAFHSSTLPDGASGGSPNGFIVTAKDSGQRLYFAGDTALFSDMKLIGDERIDVAFLPIGDYFTMGPDDAIKAVKLLNPRYVIPMHYNTFDLIAVDVSDWANRVSSETNAVPIVIDPGGTFTLPD